MLQFDSKSMLSVLMEEFVRRVFLFSFYLDAQYAKPVDRKNKAQPKISCLGKVKICLLWSVT